MSDWEEEDDVPTRTSQNAFIPPREGGWFDKTGDEEFSDISSRRPGFGRGRANRFGRNDNSSPGNRNSFNKDVNYRGFGRTEGGFGRDNTFSRDSKFTRGDNSRSWRGGETDESNDAGSWRDRGSRDNSRGFGRARGGQGRERNSTEMMVPSDDVRYIIG